MTESAWESLAMGLIQESLVRELGRARQEGGQRRRRWIKTTEAKTCPYSNVCYV